MNEQTDLLRLQAILKECSLHSDRILQAKKGCIDFFPLSSQQFMELSEDQVRIVDQLVYRFTKLQDAMGSKLFPLLVNILQQSTNLLTFHDILNILEKNMILPSSTQWLRLREVRNQITHEYESEPDNASEYLNQLFQEAETLVSLLNHVSFMVNKHILRA